MNKINDFLNNFKKFLAKGEGVKIAIQKSIEKYTKITIQLKEINISNNTIFLQLHPIKKNEILFKRNEILCDINKQTNKKFNLIK